MKMTASEKVAYLDDHLPYERMMLEYTLGKISVEQTQCDWNAYYESFVVHARNLYQFLTNDDKGNAKACDFVRDYRASKTDSTKPTFSGLLEQVFHMSPKRPSENQHKVHLADAREFHRWIDQHFCEFLDQLPPDLKPHWNQERSIPPKVAARSSSSTSTNVLSIGRRIDSIGCTGPTERVEISVQNVPSATNSPSTDQSKC